MVAKLWTVVAKHLRCIGSGQVEEISRILCKLIHVGQCQQLFSAESYTLAGGRWLAAHDGDKGRPSGSLPTSRQVRVDSAQRPGRQRRLPLTIKSLVSRPRDSVNRVHDTRYTEFS